MDNASILVDDELTVDDVEACWTRVRTPSQAEAFIRRLVACAGWVCDGGYVRRTGSTWIRGWQCLLHRGQPARQYLFELHYQALTGTVSARLVDATPLPWRLTSCPF